MSKGLEKVNTPGEEAWLNTEAYSKKHVPETCRILGPAESEEENIKAARQTTKSFWCMVAFSIQWVGKPVLNAVRRRTKRCRPSRDGGEAMAKR
jgi:hypothetical protein